jgi:hypothetical protein
MRIHAIRKMPLSIDEAETRCTLTGKDCAKRETATNQKEKGFLNIPYIYGTFTKNEKEKSSKKISSAKPSKLLARLNKKIR